MRERKTTRHPEPHDPEALTRLLHHLEEHLNAVAEAVETQLERPQPNAKKSSPQPLRQTLLDALADLGYPTDSRTLRAFASARYGVAIPTRQFGTLAVQERAIFSRGGVAARPVWLGSGLTLKGFHPVKRIWGRSDWPPDWRIITPSSNRLQHLRITEALCRLALQADMEAQDPAALRALALAHAQDLPGVVVERQHPDFARYAEIAHTVFEQLEPEDLRERLEAAEGLKKLPMQAQLFGQDAREAEE